jgi:nitrogen-specific signal transduction histidine kinase
MNLLPQCFLYTQDGDLVTRISGYLKFLARVRHISEPHELESLLGQYTPTLLIFDLRAEATRLLLPRLLKNLPETLILAFGRERSNPAIEAEAMGAYAVVGFDVERQRLQSLVRHAQEHLKVVNENQMLRREQPLQSQSDIAATATPLQAAPPSLHHLSSAFQHFDDADMMLDSMVQGIATCAKVSRVGIFAYDREGEAYHYRAGIKCLEDTKNLSVSREDPLVRWLNLHAHLVCRTRLGVVENPAERAILQYSLEAMGAEVLIPLHGRDSIIGWLFIGHRITGMPFSQADLEELMLLGEHVAVSLENQQLYEKVAVQKALADTVFDSMPVGIVAVGADCRLRWLNTAAQEILEVETEDVVKQPAAVISSRLADMLSQRIHDEALQEPFEWEEPRTKRPLSVLTRKLEADSKCIGALAIVRDRTKERLLREKEEEVERAAFWTELAAAMSHEVRNPLVAISTFAQLLPERYADPDFREKFGELVSSEISRLNGMVDQISDFAETPPLVFEECAITDILNSAIAISSDSKLESGILVEVSIDENLPKVRCDQNALTEGFAHLIRNAVEAVADAQYPSVHVTATMVDAPEGRRNMRVNVMDNGHGIPSSIEEKLFSPFCTTKPRGIGLGLPIARRTMIDHGGQIKVGSSRKGTSIEVTLPVLTPAQNTTPPPMAQSGFVRQ